jgi:hypothetical protein
MNSTGKTVNLFFLVFFLFVFVPVSSVHAEPQDGLLSYEEEPLPNNDELSLNDEKPLPGNEELLPGEKDPQVNEENIQGERLSQNEDDFDEDFFFSDEYLLFNAPGLIYEVSSVFEPRSFDEIFSGFSPEQKLGLMSSTGLRYSFEKDESPTLIPNPDSGIDLLSSVMEKKPSHIIEALVLLPYNKRELDMLDVYNALREIKNIKDYTISMSGRRVNIFKDTTRLESAKNRKPISDPLPASMLPFSETMYLCFTDQYIGPLYLRGDISISLYGITYSITNFRDVSYSIFRIMKAERFSAIIYLEPVKEGILVYSMSGLYIPGFIAHRVNLTPNINVRIRVLVNWIADGLKKEENNRQNAHFYQLLEE